MLADLRAANVALPVVFYIGRLTPGKGVPDGALGLTNRPDQLLDLVVDGLARVRGTT